MEQARILAVDDASDARILVEAVLGDRYTVTTVDSGTACLEAVAAQKPDLVLLDIHMPGMSGFEVCQQSKASQDTASIPIVFLSGTESVEERLRA